MLLFFLSGFDRSLAFPFQEAGKGKKKKVLTMQAYRQLPLPPACQALPEDCGDQFDSLIKDFRSAFVAVTEAAG